MDVNDINMHYPKDFRNAAAGANCWATEKLDFKFEQFGYLPAALDYVDVTATAPSTTDGDIYLLDDSGAVYTVSAINWQSGNTVRYTFSGSPDLSSISTANNVLYCYSAANSEHNGRFDMTAVNDGSDYVEITNTLISDATLDETTGASCELPHSAWNGASNGEWVRYDSTDSLWYRITPATGVSCYDKTLNVNRTFDGDRWLGLYREIALAVSDETSNLTTGTSKLTFRMPYKMYLSSVRASVSTAPTGSTLDIDVNESGASVFSTILTIDATEKTSTTAATAAVISDNTLADDAEITIDIDQVGSTVAGAGLKVYLLGYMI
jgi:hypothetical protein